MRTIALLAALVVSLVAAAPAYAASDVAVVDIFRVME